MEIGRRLTRRVERGVCRGRGPVLEKVRIRETDRNIFELAIEPMIKNGIESQHMRTTFAG